MNFEQLQSYEIYKFLFPFKILNLNIFCSLCSAMASHTPGIQQLLTAEKKASDKVGEARKGVLFLILLFNLILLCESESTTNASMPNMTLFLKEFSVQILDRGLKLY